MPVFEITLADGQVFEVDTDAQREGPTPPGRAFSEAAVGGFGSLLDLGANLAGVPQPPEGPGRAMRDLSAAGLTTPEALERTGLASTLGRAAGALPFGLLRPGAAGAELLGAAGGGVGEFVGQQAGGDVGGIAGGIGGSLVTAPLAGAARRTLGSRSGVEENLGLSSFLDPDNPTIGLAEIGGSPVAQFIDRLTARIPGGGMVARGRATRIALAAGRKSQELTQRLSGLAIDPEVAGRAIREGFEGHVTRFRNVGDKLFRRSERLLAGESGQPSNMLRALSELQPRSSNLSATATAIGGEEMAFISRVTNAMQDDLAASGGSLSAGRLNQIRKELGQQLTSVDIIGTPKQGVFRKLYGAATDDMRAFAHQADAEARRSGSRPAAVKAFENANKFWREGLRRVERIRGEVVRKQADSRIFNNLFNKTSQGPEIIRDLRSTLPRDQFEMAAGMVLRKMGRETPGARTSLDILDRPEESFNLNRFLTNWNRGADAKTLDTLFKGASPAMRGLKADLDRLAKVAAGSRELIQALPNSSNTAEALAASGAAIGAVSAASSGYFVQAVRGAMAVFGVGAGGQWILNHPDLTRWVAQSTRIPVAQLPQHLEKLEQVVSEDPDVAPVAQAILEQLRS